MAKATAECTCKTCGKIYTTTKICRNRADANDWEQWAAEHYDECPECYKARKQAEREEVNEQAAQESLEMGWPELNGSLRQVAWATTIRKEKIDELLARKPTEKGMRYITWIVQTHTDAKYWIDNRDWSLHGQWGIKLWDEWKAAANCKRDSE